jgi:hypothetical protein
LRIKNAIVQARAVPAQKLDKAQAKLFVVLPMAEHIEDKFDPAGHS